MKMYYNKVIYNHYSKSREKLQAPRENPMKGCTYL